jgi:hypothetical protein
MKEDTKVELNELLDEEWSGEGVGNVDSDAEVADLENFDVNEKLKEVREIKSDSDQKFKNKYNGFDLFLTKTKLKWYLAREEKHTKKYLKYKKLHTSLSLAVASGFSNIKDHQEHLKSLSQRTEKIGKVEE